MAHPLCPWGADREGLIGIAGQNACSKAASHGVRHFDGPKTAVSGRAFPGGFLTGSLHKSLWERGQSKPPPHEWLVSRMSLQPSRQAEYMILAVSPRTAAMLEISGCGRARTHSTASTVHARPPQERPQERSTACRRSTIEAQCMLPEAGGSILY